jgi:putative colanic acid biosynthesis acetyltransferase WcaB
LALFRLAQRAGRRWPAPIGLPVILLYRLMSEWLLGFDLPWQTEVGARLRLHHGYALVVHPATILGADCTLRHSTTLGTQDPTGVSSENAPRLGDGVDVGCHVLILGSVEVGDGARIGAGAVVVKDVPPRSVVAGSPARVIGEVEDGDGNSAVAPSEC